ncbi:MAG: hypothetical protein QXS20_09885 [Candidatus Thorarchaeota archaeon]
MIPRHAKKKEEYCGAYARGTAVTDMTGLPADRPEARGTTPAVGRFRQPFSMAICH